MATKRMLIDASHPEETRVVVVEGNKLDEYDVEVASRRQLKGNIYLGKITRVEPSLQAAFVDYGGNRHGFLAFSEIHPDYYQIPVADRQALLAEHAAAERAADEESADGDEDDDDLDRQRPRLSPRNYKIQEVVKRRQIMLVQVTKEERGTKGAALTTYLSLAGRYCVLMPNTSRGGGISRKIGNVNDRKRLKKILVDLTVAEGMAVIVRTAGAGRTKAEIKRDYEYLVRLWSNIRETTLQSTAPALVYEEGSLIKRSIRDLYDRDTEEIIVQGEPQYRIAKEFMKLFIPSHAKRVRLYEDTECPLFHQAQVEDQIEAMHQPIVQLRSGSYIVINPTEALVSIDVNSGRATRERHIEETALRTNLEAADEVARQLRMRDLAGLVVIDFIDMENARNQTQVERRLKEAMKNDRARIQIGRISPFGLLELSRQRMRPSLLETSFEPCPFCNSTGMMRTIESAALALLRRIEDEGIRHHSGEIVVTAGNDISLYLLNHKRRALSLIEERYGFAVRIVSEPTLTGHEFKLERMKAAALPPLPRMDEDVVEAVDEEPANAAAEAVESESEEGAKRGRRRRPRRRRREDDRPGVIEADVDAIAAVEDEAPVVIEDAIAVAEAPAGDEVEGEDEGEQAKKRRRRGKRGGRRRGRRPVEEVIASSAAAGDEESESITGGFDEANAYGDAMAEPGFAESAPPPDREGSADVGTGLSEVTDPAQLAEAVSESDVSAPADDDRVESLAAETPASEDDDEGGELTLSATVEAVEVAEPPASALFVATEDDVAPAAPEHLSYPEPADASSPANETGAGLVADAAAAETAGDTVFAEHTHAAMAEDDDAVDTERAAEPNAQEAVPEPGRGEDDGGDDATSDGLANTDAAAASAVEPEPRAETAQFDPEASEDDDEDHPSDTRTAIEVEHASRVAVAGTDDDDPESETPRRGWWQRLIT